MSRPRHVGGAGSRRALARYGSALLACLALTLLGAFVVVPSAGAVATSSSSAPLVVDIGAVAPQAGGFCPDWKPWCNDDDERDRCFPWERFCNDDDERDRCFPWERFCNDERDRCKPWERFCDDDNRRCKPWWRCDDQRSTAPRVRSS
jgi:hypothetical protein